MNRQPIAKHAQNPQAPKNPISTMAIVAAQWRHYTCGEPRYFQ
jgi:hypothetical protein